MGKIICIANQKGGVGKTTTAVNLAASMALEGQRVLLVDMDPQGNASSGVGVRPKEGERTGYHLLMGISTLKEIVKSSAVQNLFVIATNQDLAGAEVELVGEKDRALRLKRALAPIKDKLDYIIIDCPPSLSLLTLNALVAADKVIIPMQCEYYALEGLSQLVHTITRVKRALNHELGIGGILFTMYDTRNNLTRQVADEVRSHFSDKVFETIIPRNVKLSEAPSFGQPALIYDPRSKGAQGYIDLARELLSKGAAK
ncbi:MAG: hypothetical protein C0609_01360 [Deltaproteobacteria bacterium]|nr:MAG: hypothetical protein C0609_01360 [Deltaproteobacteria bacterium]